ncbi:hypothetical protein [Microvirga ossetica]|nr:hypothetical protein [Microvirga ossetica]
MSDELRKHILEGRCLPYTDDLEDGLPFFRGSIREDMTVYADMALGRLREFEAQDKAWAGPEYRAALEALKLAAIDKARTDKELAEAVRTLMDALPTWTLTDGRRCRRYLAALGFEGKDADRRPSGDPANEDAIRHMIDRMAELATGRAYPDTLDLMCGLPFYHASIHRDMHTFASRLFNDARATEDPAMQPLVWAAIELRRASLNDVSDIERMERLDAVLAALPPQDHDRRLRVRVYQASLGNRVAQLDVACASVTRAVWSAGLGEPITLDREHTRAALGWLAVAASADGYEPLTGEISKPKRYLEPSYGSVMHGRKLVDHVRKHDPLQEGEGAPRHGDERKREVIRLVGGFVEEELAAGWLQSSVDYLRRAVEEGTFIGIEMDGRMMYPAFQLKDAMTVLGVREALAELPIRDQWLRLEWFLERHLGLGGQNALEALMDGRRDKVLNAARYASLDK